MKSPIKAGQIRTGMDGSASGPDKIFAPLLFGGPLSQNYLSPHFLLICIFTSSDLHLGCWVAREPDTSIAWEQLAHLEFPKHVMLLFEDRNGGVVGNAQDTHQSSLKASNLDGRDDSSLYHRHCLAWRDQGQGDDCPGHLGHNQEAAHSRTKGTSHLPNRTHHLSQPNLILNTGNLHSGGRQGWSLSRKGSSVNPSCS